MSKLRNHAAVDLQRFVQPFEPVREVVRSVSFRVRYHEAITFCATWASILTLVKDLLNVSTGNSKF